METIMTDNIKIRVTRGTLNKAEEGSINFFKMNQFIPSLLNRGLIQRYHHVYNYIYICLL